MSHQILWDRPSSYVVCLAAGDRGEEPGRRRSEAPIPAAAAFRRPVPLTLRPCPTAPLGWPWSFALQRQAGGPHFVAELVLPLRICVTLGGREPWVDVRSEEHTSEL